MGYRGKRENHRIQEKPYGLEVVWGAIPSILAAAAPHRGGSSTNNARLVDEGNSIHLVREEKRESDEVSGEDSARGKGCLSMPHKNAGAQRHLTSLPDEWHSGYARTEMVLPKDRARLGRQVVREHANFAKHSIRKSVLISLNSVGSPENETKVSNR